MHRRAYRLSHLPLFFLLYFPFAVGHFSSSHEERIQAQAEEEDNNKEKRYLTDTQIFFNDPIWFHRKKKVHKKVKEDKKEDISRRVHIENEDAIYLLPHSFTVRTRKQILAPLFPPPPSYQELRKSLVGSGRSTTFSGALRLLRTKKWLDRMEQESMKKPESLTFI